MHFLTRLLAVLALSLAAQSQAETTAGHCPAVLQHTFTQLQDGEPLNLCEFTGKTLLVINTASKCGFTPQFEALESLYAQYQEAGLVVLGFPSDSFFQEYSDSEKTAEVCRLTYGVTFPMFEQSPVRGKNANALFQQLNAAQGAPSWNFNKYLISPEGEVLARFGSRVEPLNSPLEQAVRKQLKLPGNPTQSAPSQSEADAQ